MTGTRMILALAVVLTTGLSAQAQSEFVATSIKVDPVMQPKQPADALKECANDPVCSSIIGGAPTHPAMPATLPPRALAIASQAKKTGGQRRFSIIIPLRFTYSRSSL